MFINYIAKQVIGDIDIGFDYKSMATLQKMYEIFIIKNEIKADDVGWNQSRWIASEQFLTNINLADKLYDFLIWILNVELRSQCTSMGDYNLKANKILKCWNFYLANKNKEIIYQNKFLIIDKLEINDQNSFKSPQIEKNLNKNYVKIKKESSNNNISFFMSFSNEEHYKYNNFKSLVALKQFNIIRVDEILVEGLITEKIFEMIRESLLCVFDITNLNPNVLFELGYAFGVGANILLIMEDNIPMKTLPFNLSNYQVHSLNFKDYKDFESLGYKIIERINSNGKNE